MKQSDVVTVASLIYSQRNGSRAGLAERTNLAPSYISSIVRDLQQKGIVMEGGRAPSRAGRRRVLLHVNPELGHLLGIRMGRANIRVVVTDLLGNVRTLRKFPTQISEGKDHLLELVHHHVKPLIRHDPAIKGLGMAMSGVIDRKRGIVLFWPKVPGWDGIPLKQILETKYGLPTIVEDSVRTMALAERRFGQGKGYSDFVYVAVGMGIGTAVFVDGNLYYGSEGLAGELGHTTFDERGELCSCGNRGCLEVYASGWAIINSIRTG